ncbi:hypothetical protein BH11BAC1_BH11BAC1_30670 [soil metagenome]
MKKTILLSISLLLAAYSQAQHTVMMKNGDKLEGLVTSLNNGVIEIQRNQTISKINLSEVSEIIFDKPGTKATNEIGEKSMTAGSYFIRYKVADRIISKAPRIDNMTQKKGTVVVNVSINKYGNVIKATPGAPGSTTSDEYLYTKAKQGAESAIFNNVPTAPLEQTGYIIIPF